VISRSYGQLQGHTIRYVNSGVCDLMVHSGQRGIVFDGRGIGLRNQAMEDILRYWLK